MYPQWTTIFGLWLFCLGACCYTLTTATVVSDKLRIEHSSLRHMYIQASNATEPEGWQYDYDFPLKHRCISSSHRPVCVISRPNCIWRKLSQTEVGLVKQTLFCAFRRAGRHNAKDFTKFYIENYSHNTNSQHGASNSVISALAAQLCPRKALSQRRSINSYCWCSIGYTLLPCFSDTTKQVLFPRT